MSRDEILERLRGDAPTLGEYGVARIGLFGSAARGEAAPGSDVDILVTFDDGVVLGLFGFAKLKNHLEDLLGQPVDLATPTTLHAALRDKILNEAVYAEGIFRVG